MKIYNIRRLFLVVIVFSLMVLGACSTNKVEQQSNAGTDAATNSGEMDDWPTKPISIIVPFGAGGSADRSARGFAAHMSEELGQQVVVENFDGAGGLIGTTRFIEDSGSNDGYTLFMGVQPNISSNIVNDGASFGMEDFSFLNAHWSDSMVVSVPKNSNYNSLQELVDEIKENPGKVTLGTINSTAEHLYSFTMLEELGILNDVRVVYFDGGNDLRTALLGSQIDFIVDQLEGAIPILDQIKPLATVTAEENKHLPEVPTINEALSSYGIEVPIIQGSIRVLAVKSTFKENYPERWQKLLDAYVSTLESDEFKGWLETNKIPGDWHGPEASTKMVMDYHDVVVEAKDLLSGN